MLKIHRPSYTHTHTEVDLKVNCRGVHACCLSFCFVFLNLFFDQDRVSPKARQKSAPFYGLPTLVLPANTLSPTRNKNIPWTHRHSSTKRLTGRVVTHCIRGGDVVGLNPDFGHWPSSPLSLASGGWIQRLVHRMRPKTWRSLGWKPVYADDLTAVINQSNSCPATNLKRFHQRSAATVSPGFPRGKNKKQKRAEFFLQKWPIVTPTLTLKIHASLLFVFIPASLFRKSCMYMLENMWQVHYTL